MVVCVHSDRQDSLYQPIGGTAGLSGLTAAFNAHSTSGATAHSWTVWTSTTKT
ncbi:MAG: hypothetical protein J07HN4v3_00105 [Halonotius sp. J07HN4]|nr:MAG: hypothetical protein J07HN4v3_00105 [Halonotius sp. J07HN4]